MSYNSASMRVNELNARMGVAPSNLIMPSGFKEVLYSAKNRFSPGPQIKDDPVGADFGGLDGAGFAAGAAGTAGTARAPRDLNPIFERLAAKHGVPAALAKAVARAESGFRADAVSPAGAQGIMQLMPATGRGLGVKDPFNVEQNIEGGIKYLKNTLDRFGGDVKLALAAYNAGPNAVARFGGVPPYPETQNYVKKVMGYAREYGLTSTRIPRH